MAADAPKRRRSKANRFAFTAESIRKLKAPDKGREYHYDTKQPGLALCVTAAGSRTFYVYRKIAGRPERLRLGSLKDMPLTSAREITQAIVGRVAAGDNPAVERRQARNVPTLRELFDRWVTIHAEHHRRTLKEDRRVFDKYLAPFHGHRLDRITAGKVAEWHANMGTDHGPIQANRALGLLSTLFNWAPQIDCECRNPCRNIRRFRERSRERFLTADEAGQFFTALEKQPPAWRHYFTLLLFTGVRKNNLSAMRWEDVDFTGRVWAIPRTKNDDPMVVPLSPPAIKVLKERLDERNGSEWVFPGRAGHIKDPRKAWTKLLADAGLENLHLHDLRRSLGSWQAALGSSLAIIGASLGHRDLKSTQIYSRLDVDPVRKSVESAVAAMQAAADGRASGNGTPSGRT